jgi:hypothetical protein
MHRKPPVPTEGCALAGGLSPALGDRPWPASGHRPIVIFLLATLLLGSGLGCAASRLIARAPTETPAPVRTPRPTFTPTPDWTATPTDTPTPTNTLIPTATPLPTDTPTPAPSDTPLPTNTRPPPPPTDTPAPTEIPPTPTPAYEFSIAEAGTLTSYGGLCAGNNFAVIEFRLSTADDDAPVLGYVVRATNKATGQVIDSVPSYEMGFSAAGQGWNHRVNLKIEIPGGYDGSTWELHVISGDGQQISPSWEWTLDPTCHNPAFVNWRKISG